MNRKPVDIYQDPTIRGLRDASLALLAELATDSVNLQTLITRIQAQRERNDDENLYNEPWAIRLTEAAYHIQMTLRAAGVTP